MLDFAERLPYSQVMRPLLRPALAEHFRGLLLPEHVAISDDGHKITCLACWQAIQFCREPSIADVIAVARGFAGAHATCRR